MTMEWFNGGVLNAISACRQERALFIVYVSDDSEASQETLQAWNSDEVIQFLKTMKSVALKVSKYSTEFSQFSQFFAVFTFPSVYCIDLSGKPLVVLNGKQTPEMLKSKLSEAFVKMEEQLPTSSESPTQHGSNIDGKVSPERHFTSSPSASEASPTASESKAEKLKRYEEKIKQKRQEGSEAAKQHEIDLEKDRRSQGKDVMKLKETQAEERNKNWLKERQKEKEEARLARDEVRAKLEQDRRERDDKQQAVSLRQRSQKTTSQQFKSDSHSTLCRVQLRLPTGSSKVVELGVDDTLGMLRERVSEVVDTASASLSLIRLYPRLELTADMDVQSMVDLKLTPTGVIIVKVDKGSSADDRGSNLIWATFMSTLNFVVWIFSVIKKFVVSLFSSTRKPAHQEPGSRPDRFDAEKRLHKFRQDDYKDEDSDDTGTYNGNSTQQQ